MEQAVTFTACLDAYKLAMLEMATALKDYLVPTWPCKVIDCVGHQGGYLIDLGYDRHIRLTMVRVYKDTIPAESTLNAGSMKVLGMATVFNGNSVIAKEVLWYGVDDVFTKAYIECQQARFKCIV